MPASLAPNTRGPSPGSGCATDALVTGSAAARSRRSASICALQSIGQWGKRRPAAVHQDEQDVVAGSSGRPACCSRPVGGRRQDRRAAAVRWPAGRAARAHRSASFSLPASEPASEAVDFERLTARSRSLFFHSVCAARMSRTCPAHGRARRGTAEAWAGSGKGPAGAAGGSGAAALAPRPVAWRRPAGARGGRSTAHAPAAVPAAAATPACGTNLRHGGAALGQHQHRLVLLLRLLPAQRRHGRQPALRLHNGRPDLGVAAAVKRRAGRRGTEDDASGTRRRCQAGALAAHEQRRAARRARRPAAQLCPPPPPPTARQHPPELQAAELVLAGLHRRVLGHLLQQLQGLLVGGGAGHTERRAAAACSGCVRGAASGRAPSGVWEAGRRPQRWPTAGAAPGLVQLPGVSSFTDGSGPTGP